MLTISRLAVGLVVGASLLLLGSAAQAFVLAPVSTAGDGSATGDAGFKNESQGSASQSSVAVGSTSNDSAAIEVEVIQRAAAQGTEGSSSSGTNSSWHDAEILDSSQNATSEPSPIVGESTLGLGCLLLGGCAAPAAPTPGPALTPPPEQVDPLVLAQRATAQIQVPLPEIGVGPSLDRVAVNLWTWLWITPPDPVQVTVSAGAISVTAIAELTSVDWTMGEPTKDPESGQVGTPAVVSCEGAGVAPDLESYDWKAEPPCGYKYQQRSLPERTAGRGTWTLTATANWTVNWQATTGETGTTTLTSAAVEEVAVGEYRTLLVDQPR